MSPECVCIGDISIYYDVNGARRPWQEQSDVVCGRPMVAPTAGGPPVLRRGRFFLVGATIGRLPFPCLLLREKAGARSGG